VGVLVSLRLRLQENRQFSEGGLQLLFKGLVSGLGEKRLLFKDGPDTHGLLKHDDGSSKVHAEIDHFPVNAFLDILLLLNNKHVMVEELLELLVDKVDGDLLESVVLKDLKSSDVEHSTEVCLLESGINKSVVTLLDEPSEDTIKDGSGDTTHSHSGLFTGLTLDHPFGSNLDPRLTESLDQLESVNTEGT